MQDRELMALINTQRIVAGNVMKCVQVKVERFLSEHIDFSDIYVYAEENNNRIGNYYNVDTWNGFNTPTDM